jgi:hypothetical protein
MQAAHLKHGLAAGAGAAPRADWTIVQGWSTYAPARITEFAQ